MPGRILRCALAIVILLISPSPAHADMMGFWRWWDSLSGPGPFNGFVTDVPLVTYGRKAGALGSDPVIFFDPSGLDADQSRRPIKFGVQFGFLEAEQNNLPYVGRPAPGVRAIPIAATADVRVYKGIDVGSTIGLVRFSGDGFGFWRTTVTPRVSIAPVALLSRDWKRKYEAFQVRLFATSILGEIDAADFGAVGGFKGGNEILLGTTFTVNLLAFKN